MKKGQITVFIILGIVILIVAMLMFQLVKETKVGQLEEEREKVIEKSFKKEGLRFYVVECLEDELREGLIKLGRQGRLWSDQEGGSLDFVDKLTGTYLGEERIFYGIVFDKKGYLPKNKYPCEGGESPDFCKYKYPNSSIVPNYPVKFGGRQLETKAIERDLKNYLINRTIWCVENFTKTNISPAVKISTENLEIDLDLLNEGISVKVEYPLTLSLAGEEFFHLAKFDFFYPTKFKRLLEAAVTYPLRLDWSFVDFNYSNESLKSDFFITAEEKQYTMRKSEYRDLGIEFRKEELGEGDDLFWFEVKKGIVGSVPYVFQFARQNRPPALDYIEKDYCDEDGYDYLVMEGEDVNIDLLARDPDEDVVISYEVNDTELPGNLLVNNFKVDKPNTGWYNITVITTDGYLSDWQKVRILVDRVMKTDVSLWMPYNVDYSLDGIYRISNEDPVFINVTIPGESKARETSIPLVTLNYSSPGEGFEYELPGGLTMVGESGCFSLPWLRSATSHACDINDYSENDLEDWKGQLEDDLDFGHFRSTTETGFGELNLTFAITYCGKNNQSDSKEVKISVEQCVPHWDSSHPYPYMLGDEEYYKWEYGLDEKGETNFSDFKGSIDDFNPFLATHSCCDFNWNAKPLGTVCFVNPEPDCYGGVEYYALLGSDYQHYVLEQEFGTCDGERGNICGGEKVYDLWKGELKCGNNSNDLPGCNGIRSECENQLAWGYVDTNNNGTIDGWCNGKMGCEKFCSKEVVYDVLGASIQSPGLEGINYLARTNPATDNSEVKFKCGCGPDDDGKPCDYNLDGVFGGQCNEGYCCDVVGNYPEDSDPHCSMLWGVK